MLKKTVLTFAFLSILTTFYGFNPAWSGRTDSLLDDAVSEHALLDEGDYVISAYDNIIRSVSEREGYDWRLMSAIAYHESRFTADITSHRGARGLMQIMPATARQFGVPTDEVLLPQTNVMLACKLMSKIRSSLRFSPATPETERLRIILACYNSGIGHVGDARRLAKANGENPDSWAVVARYLQLKADPAYYEREVVECGRFGGSAQTLAYVDGVMGRYAKYCRIATV